MKPQVLVTAYGFGVYRVEYAPSGTTGHPPSLEVVGMSSMESEVVQDPEDPEIAYVMTPSGFPPCGMENVTADDLERLRNVLRRTGNDVFLSRLSLFDDV